jgi:hypothetical protein
MPWLENTKKMEEWKKQEVGSTHLALTSLYWHSVAAGAAAPFPLWAAGAGSAQP